MSKTQTLDTKVQGIYTVHCWSLVLFCSDCACVLVLPSLCKKVFKLFFVVVVFVSYKEPSYETGYLLLLLFLFFFFFFFFDTWFLCVYLAGLELRNLPDLDYLKETELLKCLNFERPCDV